MSTNTVAITSAMTVAPAFVVVNKSDFTQTVFLGADPDIAEPSLLVYALHTIVPDCSLDVNRVVVGQTEPSLARLISADAVTNLRLNASDWTFGLRIKVRATGLYAVDTTAVTYTLQADGTGLLEYPPGANDFAVTGPHDFQFRAIRNADQRVLYWSAEMLTVRAE